MKTYVLLLRGITPTGKNRVPMAQLTKHFNPKGLHTNPATYAGEKGNLRFPLDKPIPYALIGRIVRALVKENLAKEAP